jgi:hypothetical protein
MVMKNIIGDIGGFLGKAGGDALGKMFGFRKGTKKVKKESPVLMKRGGKARLVKGSKAAKAYMAKIRRMRK